MIGVIAGSGQLPILICDSLKNDSKPYVVASFSKNFIENNNVPIHFIQWGKVGALLSFFKEYGVTHVVMAGALTRPSSWRDMSLDWQGIKWINKLKNVWQKGDDALLSAVVELFETAGFNVLAARDILCGKAKPGVWTKARPSEENQNSIQLGVKLLNTLSSFDMGQAVIISGEQVLGIEGPEGTEQLIKRCVTFTPKGDAILVKMAKLNQSLKADCPTVGPDTIASLAEGGYKGLAFQHELTHALFPEEMITLANESGLFIEAF